jgi:hypothetical protein
VPCFLIFRKQKWQYLKELLMPGVGQHAGMAASQKLKGWVNIQEYILQTLPNGWVNMQELAAKPKKNRIRGGSTCRNSGST